ncbi:hypothetical protein KUCAC02_024542 [Chaenocephalus aceratus]|uniref:Uncharacterized protein n=1 Tax=Chaenocephalus aceratus TaxID=36190 RepID=A0ACB9WIU4_CHAAC|nr:hypothetical protein KUCAC02_024542 [Chaenocephalus aceratus]
MVLCVSDSFFFVVIKATLEEPPYLTVGTDVSAKYRGAFCEAKIKTAKRLVKAKVTFKPDLTTAEVHDENIKGVLKVGSVVEVKNQDGVYQEATINKLTDASIYTVVFDDGDEKTLRRSSLCLKGARHFAESETLDRLPLPTQSTSAHLSIGKKGETAAGDRTQFKKKNCLHPQRREESTRGRMRICSAKWSVWRESPPGRKRKPTWYPALVISPDCHDDVTVKKDNIFVRSFKDGKFNTVLRKDIRELNGDCPPKADAGLKPALDAALEFLHLVCRAQLLENRGGSGAVPRGAGEPFCSSSTSSWKTEASLLLRNSHQQAACSGLHRTSNLFKLYRLVHKLGGFNNIESGAVWKLVYQDLGIPVLKLCRWLQCQMCYRKYLNGFEEYCTSTAITFRMDLPLKQAPKGEVKSEGEVVATHAPSSSSEEQKPQVDGEPSSTQLIVCKDEKPDLTRKKTEPEPIKTDEKESEDDEEEDSPLNGDADEGSSTARLGGESVKEECDEEQESKDNSGDDSSQEGEEGEEFECYPPGMKVQVRYGRGRSLKTYEATVKEADVEGGEVLYLVHYCGWNVRYDEWIKAEKIVRPANKNVQKIKHRKKIKNKAERERRTGWTGSMKETASALRLR